LAKKYGLSYDAVARHWRNHVTDTVKAASIAKVLKPGEDLQKLVTDESIGLLENLQRIRGILYSQFDAAAEASDRGAVASLATRLHENLRMAATKTGELEQHVKLNNVTNIILSPAYLELRTMLLAALRRHPEAAGAVVEAFRRVEVQSGLLGSDVIDAKPAAA
jgi:hypothetical protein